MTTFKAFWNVLPEHDGKWTVWSEVITDPVAGGGEQHCKAIASSPEEAHRFGGMTELALRSPDGTWYRWAGLHFVRRSEGGAVAWCNLDDIPSAMCPRLPWRGSPDPSPARCLPAQYHPADSSCPQAAHGDP
jgi:hypothetical protein